MIKSVLVFCLFTATAYAAPKYELRGQLSTRLSRYTKDSRNNYGHRHYAQFEQLSVISESLSFLNQARWSSASLYSDLGPQTSLQGNDEHEVYPGENFVKWQSESAVFQLGYQQISWGEAFGFNYADFINPKDQTITAYSDASESKYPLLLANTKFFFPVGSLQLLYSPEPRFSRTLPVSIFTKPLLPSIEVLSYREKTPDVFDKHEYGGKLSLTIAGVDAAIFYYDYYDRNPYYALVSATTTQLTIAERHDRIHSYGVSLAKTLFDDFVLRSDIVLSQDKKYNSIASTILGPNLVSEQSDEMNTLISFDTPAYNNLSALLVYANSTVDQLSANAFRAKKESYAIARLSYDFGEEKVLDLSYTHQFEQSGHGIQTQLLWPVSDSLELKFGAEHYWGENASTFGKIKNISNVFFGIKNYFQL